MQRKAGHFCHPRIRFFQAARRPVRVTAACS